MMRLLGLILLLASGLLAAPPEVKLVADKPQAKFGELVTITATTDAKSIRLKVEGNVSFATDSNGRKIYLSLTESVRVHAVAASETGELSEFATLELLAEKKPSPGPVPTPEPKPPTPAKLKSVRVAVVMESADKSALKVQYLQDEGLKALWKERGWDAAWWIDPDDLDPKTKATPERWAPYVKQAKALKLPITLFIVNRENGEVVYEGAPPDGGPAGLLKLLKDKTGE